MALFGDKLRELRTNKNISQLELAEAVGTDRTAIAKYETNATAPNVYVAFKLAEFFKVSLDYFMHE